MIFSRLQALDIDELHQHDRALFIPLIERCAESQIWKVSTLMLCEGSRWHVHAEPHNWLLSMQVREIAARAYGSVVPPREAFTASRQLLERCDLRNQNGLHGRLLQIRRLIISAFDSASSPLGALELDAALREKTSTLLIQNRCPATCAAFLEVVLAFAKVAVHIKQSPPYSDAAPVSTFAVVQAWVDQRLATTNELPSQDALAQLLQEPCEPALLALCARTSLDPVMNKPVPETPLALLNHSCEDVRLEALQSLEGLGPLDQLSQDGQRKVCIKLHELVRQADEGIWVRVKAAEVLQDGWSSVAARLQCIQQSLVARGGKGDEQHLDLQDECFALSQIALTTACVPLREAVLPYFGTLVSLVSIRSPVSPSVSRAHVLSSTLQALDRYVAHEWVSQTVGSWCMILSLCGDESEVCVSRRYSMPT